MSCKYCEMNVREIEHVLSNGGTMTVIEANPEIETLNQESDEIDFHIEADILWATYNSGENIVAMSGLVLNYCPICGELPGIPYTELKEENNG